MDDRSLISLNAEYISLKVRLIDNMPSLFYTDCDIINSIKACTYNAISDISFYLDKWQCKISCLHINIRSFWSHLNVLVFY